MTRNSQEARPLSNPATDATMTRRTALAQGDTGLADRAVSQLGGERTPAEVSLQASALAHLGWGKCEDRTARTAPGRAAFEQRFLDEADGDPVRAASLRTAYYKDLARQSVAARRRNRQAREQAAS